MVDSMSADGISVQNNMFPYPVKGLNEKPTKVVISWAFHHKFRDVWSALNIILSEKYDCG